MRAEALFLFGGDMIDINVINEKIMELENDEETALNCRTLASLYVIRDHHDKKLNGVVESEFKDILPQYKTYVEIKRKYQMDEITTTAVIKQLNLVCIEIEEFLFALYNNTDFAQEREILSNMIDRIKIDFDQKVRK